MNVRVRENSYFDTPEYYQKINSAAAETMQIACVIFQDMLIHVFGLPEDHANVMWGQTENGSPAFAFVCPDGYHEKFEAFWNTLSRIKLKPNDNVWAYDNENKAISVDELPYVVDIIANIFSHYHVPRKTLQPIKPKSRSSKKIEPEDLIYLDKRAFLGEKDFQESFNKAIQDSAYNFYRHYIYNLEDLEKSIQALINTREGIVGYSVNDVFRFQ